MADNEGRTNNLRFALSIKISLKGVLKPSATCTSLASYITKQPQWGDGSSVCVCVCARACVYGADERGAQVSTGVDPPGRNSTSSSPLTTDTLVHTHKHSFINYKMHYSLIHMLYIYTTQSLSHINSTA